MKRRKETSETTGAKTGTTALPGTENIKFKIVKNKLTIETDLSYRGQITAKGNARVCSTLGNKEIPGTKGIMLGINMYVGVS